MLKLMKIAGKTGQIHVRVIQRDLQMNKTTPGLGELTEMKMVAKNVFTRIIRYPCLLVFFPCHPLLGITGETHGTG